MAIHEIEVWVLVDANGDYGVGRDEDGAKDNYDSEIDNSLIGSRMVKMTLKVEMPDAVELEAAIPCEQGKAIVTSIKA